MTDCSDCGESMRFARNLMDMTQNELAEELGWSIRQVSNIETGARSISKQTKLAIEALLRRNDLWDEFINKCGWD